MYAMQYRVVLPADYDMSIIRRRVETKGSFLDDAPGLGIKAYLIRERGQGSPTNEYAPFYLWTDVASMGRFLWGGGGFQGIVADFGRPVVRHWTGIQFLPGPNYGGDPATATVTRTPLPPDTTPMEAVASARDLLEMTAKTEGVHSAALALDPTQWELLRFTLWSSEAPPTGADESYTVLHLSRPHMEDLATVQVGS